MSEQTDDRRVNWRHVGVYYGIAFGGAVVMAVVIWALGFLPAQVAGVATVAATAILYMPLPLVAGLITERVARRRPLIAQEWQALRHRFFRVFGRNALVSVALMVVILALCLLVAWLAGTAGLPGAGHLAGSDAEFAEQLRRVNPAAATAGITIPVIVVATLVQGLIAGLTINTVFAFGEEYGWRGVLAHELRPLGLVKATALTGVLWGLWHAPIIVLGHNYGSEWGWGIPMMVTWTVPLAFLLTWAKERTGSVLAPSMLHGLFNAMVGIFTVLIVGGQLFVSFPVGILLGVTLTILALVVWRIPSRTVRDPIDERAVTSPDPLG